mmetsp:Transcript_13760/g.39620  ORF Transcript_13760/g.39620 Transcript_13760/m.39620 type:complete len:219 (+) Transcript_13760:52-708(+)
MGVAALVPAGVCCAETAVNEEIQLMPKAEDSIELEIQATLMPSNDPESNDPEKERLRTSLKDFWTQSLRGRPIKILREVASAVERSEVNFKLNSQLDQFRIEQRGAAIEVALADVMEVYSLEDDGAEVFPQGIVASLTEEERPLLMRVIYAVKGGKHKMASVCLLETTVASRQQFSETMRVLHLKAVAARKGSRSHISFERLPAQPEVASQASGNVFF